MGKTKTKERPIRRETKWVLSFFKESARFCINTRLRTPLGGPVQTFEAIERMLLRYITPTQAEQGIQLVGSEQANNNLLYFSQSKAKPLPGRNRH